MGGHACPVWVGHLLASPLRRFAQDPAKILGAHVTPGMTVLDVGCATGFFSLPLARLVGPNGRVVCADLQEPLLRALQRRARRAGVSGRIETHLCAEDSLRLTGCDGVFDFALAFAVVHEVPDPARLFHELGRALRTGANLLFGEPALHVRERDFAAELAAAREAGFTIAGSPPIRRARAALLARG